MIVFVDDYYSLYDSYSDVALVEMMTINRVIKYFVLDILNLLSERSVERSEPKIG